jgi:hypothetical protein
MRQRTGSSQIPALRVVDKKTVERILASIERPAVDDDFYSPIGAIEAQETSVRTCVRVRKQSLM